MSVTYTNEMVRLLMKCSLPHSLSFLSVWGEKKKIKKRERERERESTFTMKTKPPSRFAGPVKAKRAKVHHVSQKNGQNDMQI